MNLKTECHKYIDELTENKEEKRKVYKWLGRKMHIKGLHFSNLTPEQLLHARRLLKWLKSQKEKKNCGIM